MKVILIFIFFLSSAFSFEHDHKLWDTILSEFLVKKESQILIKYKKLSQKRMQLRTYLDSLSSVTSTEFNKFSFNQKKAFFINAYNAFTVEAILDNPSVKSIKDIKKIWSVEKSFFGNVWGIEFIPLLGKKRSLDWIEHDVLRKDYKDPRIHAAVNCASMGCPSLYKEAFIATKLDKQLDETMGDFIRNGSRNFLDEKSKKLKLSKIFDWYEKDFKSIGIKQYMIRYMKLTDKQKNLILSDEVSIDYNSYDWSLNKID